MSNMRAGLYPNPIDIIVVMLTCLFVLILAFPLSAAEQTWQQIEVFEVEFSVADHQAEKARSSERTIVKGNSSRPVKAVTVKQRSSDVSMDALKQRLKSSSAIGMFSKLEIRSDIVGLADDIHRYRKQGMLEAKLDEVRNDFDLLILKIVNMLEADPMLSRDIYAGRESIWKSLLHIDV